MAEFNGNSSTGVNMSQMLQNPPNICNNSSIGDQSCKCSSSSDDNFHEDILDQKADINHGLKASREGGEVEKISPNMTVHTNLCISENYINKQSTVGKEKQLCPRESTKGKVELCDHQLGLCDATSEVCYEKKLTVTCAPIVDAFTDSAHVNPPLCSSKGAQYQQSLHSFQSPENSVIQPLHELLQEESATGSVGSHQVCTGPEITSSDIVVPQGNAEPGLQTSSSKVKLVTETTSHSVPASMQENHHGVQSHAKTTIAFFNLENKKEDIAPRLLLTTIPQSTLATLSCPLMLLPPQFVSTAIDMAVTSVSRELSYSSFDCSNKQLGSSSIRLASNQVTVAPTLSPCLQVSAATHQQVAESKGSVVKEEPVPSSFTGISSSSGSRDTASVITEDSTNIAPQNPTAISNFTPCSKCNSLLVCLCSKASPSEVVPAVSPLSSSAFCEGICSSNTNGNEPNSPPPDVKPQILPVVVSMILMLPTGYSGFACVVESQGS